jgi:hypothetical protein
MRDLLDQDKLLKVLFSVKCVKRLALKGGVAFQQPEDGRAI